MLLSIPIAWLQLIHHRVRFIATLIGIAFVVILLFMQVGFQDAMFESAVRVHKTLDGDLFLLSSQYKSLTSQQGFPRTRLYQTLALDEVESVSPLYFQFGKLKNIENGQKYAIFTFGIDPGQRSFTLPEINQNLDKLKLPDAALFDRDSRPEFGPIANEFEQGKKAKIEIASYSEITIANSWDIEGLFSIGTSFGFDGILITNTSTFLQTFRDRNADEINVGLVKLTPGANPERVRDILVASLPNDIKIVTRSEFIELEKQYWDLRTPIGFAFKIMVTMGFIVGIGVAYQVLYSNIASHIVEYATLKAIGFTNNYLLNVVFKQALILAFVGYIPGLIISVWIYDFTKNATRLPVKMTPDKITVILVSVLVMCTVSGVLAIQKLRAADPAEIF